MSLVSSLRVSRTRRYYTADTSAAYPGAQDATSKGNESDKLLAGVVTQ
jgi:hypothetical protein